MSCPTSTPPPASRRQDALNVRVAAANLAFNRPHPAHHNNCSEQDHPYAGNYSKALQHDALGDVLPASYQSMLTALTTRAPADFEAILLGPGGKKLTNPQAGFTFPLEGPDPASVTMPPAPRIDSAQSSSEMAELYWMALARDIHFSDWATHPLIAQAASSLTNEFTDFRGPRVSGAVTPDTIFRGIFGGELVGPYLSQFLWKGNSDPGAPTGLGRSDADGFIRYGALKIDQRRQTVVAGRDHMESFNTWLDVQNGWDARGGDVFDTSQRRYIRNLRDLANFVHFDTVADAFFNAAMYLLSEPTGNQLLSSARPLVDAEFPRGPLNPYNAYIKQDPFATYGQAHLLSLVWEVLSRALRAVWFQKWSVHRRLRPEELGGRIDNQLAGRRSYPIDHEILDSLSTGGLSPFFPTSYGAYVLPQAYSEGAPTHPAYGAGHATAAGACATILKAYFDESVVIENPRIPNATGTSLLAYTGPGWSQMTVGRELNKLAGNIALGRNAAGVHWRTDYDASLRLGEQIATELLQEQSLLFNEGGGFTFTRFDGCLTQIQGGQVTHTTTTECTTVVV